MLDILIIHKSLSNITRSAGLEIVRLFSSTKEKYYIIKEALNIT